MNIGKIKTVTVKVNSTMYCKATCDYNIKWLATVVV